MSCLGSVSMLQNKDLVIGLFPRGRLCLWPNLFPSRVNFLAKVCGEVAHLLCHRQDTHVFDWILFWSVCGRCIEQALRRTTELWMPRRGSSTVSGLQSFVGIPVCLWNALLGGGRLGRWAGFHSDFMGHAHGRSWGDGKAPGCALGSSQSLHERGDSYGFL